METYQTETYEHIEWFLINIGLTEFSYTAGWVSFAIGHNRSAHRWEAGYRDEGHEDIDYPCWIGPFGIGSTWEEAVKDAYEKYSKVADDLCSVISNLIRPMRFRRDGEYRYVTIGDNGVTVEKIVYIKHGYDVHSFWRPSGNVLQIRKDASLWVSVFEVKP